MSQQRLGPFEMHTKTVSPRGPPLVPYNKVYWVRFISKNTLHEIVIQWNPGNSNSPANSNCFPSEFELPRFYCNLSDYFLFLYPGNKRNSCFQFSRKQDRHSTPWYWTIPGKAGGTFRIRCLKINIWPSQTLDLKYRCLFILFEHSKHLGVRQNILLLYT